MLPAADEAFLTDLLTGLAVLSAMGLVVAALALPRVVGELPVRFFVDPPAPARWGPRDVARNVLGAGVVLAGVAMLVLPGQGILTVIAGLVLTDVPGKHRLLRWLVALPGVGSALQHLRARAGVEPLELEGRPPS